MARAPVRVNHLMPLFEARGLTKRDIVFIKEQIAGPLHLVCGGGYTPRPHVQETYRSSPAYGS
jgi:hypothetical protein